MHAKEFVDTNKYPIDRLPDEGCLASLADWQLSYVGKGVCVLKRFIRSESMAQFIAEANELAPLGYHNILTGNAYLEDIDESWPSKHARRLTETTSLAAVAGDLFPVNSAIGTLYEWDTLTELIRLITGLDQLHRYECPLGRLNLSVMRQGDYLRWHFDQSDFVVSIPLQEADSGGTFEFSHNIRGPETENYDRVAAVLQGGRSEVEALEAPPGSLILFKGKHTLHRVTRIEGDKPRIYALLGYARQPNVQGSDYLNRIRYGRS